MAFIDKLRQEAAYDAGIAYPTSWGVGGLQIKKIDLTGSGAAVTDAPETGKFLTVTDINVSTDTSLIVHFFTEGVASPFWSEILASGGGAQRTWRGTFKLPTVNKKVIAQASASGNVSVLVGYHSEA